MTREAKQITGPRIRAARKAAKLTQEELAAKIGARQPELSDWEHGDHLPSAVVLKNIALTLGVAMESLLP